MRYIVTRSWTGLTGRVEWHVWGGRGRCKLDHTKKQTRAMARAVAARLNAREK